MLINNADNNIIISINETYEILLLESISSIPRINSIKDQQSITNKFDKGNRPSLVIIEDSFNNPFFPIKPYPQIDTAKMDLFLIFNRFRELYTQQNTSLLPWHYVIEFIENKYYIFNTRPIDMKFPLSNNESLDRQDLFNKTTKNFISNNQYDIADAIHILIIGNSDIDIYTKKFYELLGRFCIVPFYRYFKFPEQRLYFLNIGKKFNQNILTKFLRR